MNRLRSFSFLIGLALFAYLISQLNLQVSWDRLKQLDFSLFFLAILVGAPEILFKSLRLKSFMAKAKAHISLKNAILSFLSGQPLAAITPGRLGDVSRIVLLSRFGHVPTSTGLAIHAADRIYDLASILLLAVIGLVSFTAEFKSGSAIAAVIGILTGMFLMLALLNPRWLKFLLKPMVNGLLSEKLAAEITYRAKEFYSKLHLLLIPSYKVFGPFVLSFLAWEAAILRSFTLAMALGLPLSYLKFALLVPIMVVVELLPISILGLGPKEATLFMLFSTVHLPHEDLLALSLLMVISGPVLTALIGIPAAVQIIPKKTGPHAHS